MGVIRERYKLSRLIPKNHFCSMPIFREEPLISWPFTDTVLFTAYDVYRSNDFWLDNVIKSGQTLKEGLVELGFPKEKTLVADTGVFELEAKKAGLARDLGIDVDFEMSNEQIFEVYELSGADYYVAPDLIVLATDSTEVVSKKVDTIKQNLVDLLNYIPASKIIAVIQGHTKVVIDDLYDFYMQQGISCFAIGGVIPLYHHSKDLLEKVLKYVRELAKSQWLHVFGLPIIALLNYYLHDINIDSVDTSALLYLSARRQYLVSSRTQPVREAIFKRCECLGCRNLSPEMASYSQEFFINLYIHNLSEAAKLAIRPNPNVGTIIDSRMKVDKIKQHSKKEKTPRQEYEPIEKTTWLTAEEVIKMQRKEGVGKTTPENE
ncbi:MAG: hypothetical protein JW779_03065 [Candidatus Thorarchaeota archaeon]|nr:hypothetical protein [Candidatus Thorarchaeota archaeon]